MAARTHVDVAGMFRPAGTLDAATALQPYRGTLDERSAAHLLRRAGFGGTPAEIARYVGTPAGRAVDGLIALPPAQEAGGPSDLYSPVSLVARYGRRRYRRLAPADRKALIKEIRRNELRSMVALRVWWLNRMLSTPAPLQEKMTLHFHGHFTTSPILKGVSPTMIYAQNQLFRAYALGNVRELTRAVAKDPAMLCYLDNRFNVKGRPNENFARELMELFTLGVDHYTEEDVRQSARAWTGWRFDPFTERAYFDPRLHDDGVKTFLGRSGNFNGDDIVDIIYAQPQAARFWATWLLGKFVYNDPEPALTDGVAALLRAHDFELAPVVSALLRSNVFFSPRAYRARVKSPVEFVVGTYKSLDAGPIDRRVIAALKQMGELPFYPPNVAGWPGGANWLTSVTMIARQNFLVRTMGSQTLAQSRWLNGLPLHPQSAAAILVDRLLDGDAAPAAVRQLESVLGGAGTAALAALSAENYDERVRAAAYLTLAMPAYQLS
jgi:hypothetical protein